MINWIYALIAVLLILALIEDEDDDQGGGKMIPAYQKTN